MNNKITLKERAKELKTDIPAVFIAMKDKDTPLSARLLGALAVGYILSPVDLIPDFIPVLGYLDDVILVPALIALTVKHIPDEIWTRSKEAADGQFENEKLKKWYYALPVVLIWLLIIWFIVKAVWL